MRLITILLALAVAARANLPPDKPTITEPKVDGRTVNSEDVHMETAAFSDPDPGDTHASSDWEIWTVGASAERVWAALAKTGVERVHLHFGDGVFEHSLAGQRALTPETDYELRARHRDAAGAVSEVAVRAFRTLPKPARVPGAEWLVLDLDYAVEVVATGFQLPVNIAFVPQPTFHPGDPLFYVTELYGTIKVMTTDGTVSDYATGLLNFPATGNFPGDGEQGLAGIAVDAATGDIFASLLYLGGDGEHHPKVVRFHSNDGGLTAATQTTILDMAPEVQGQSHQVSNLSFGPDGKLYVHMGDGFETATSRDLKQYRGKILRMNLNGTPARGNPFLNARDGITSKDFVFAYGFRNPFGGAWRALDRAHYTVENGPGVDRFSRTRRSKDYRFDGSDGSMSRGALYNWDPAVGPVNVAFIQPTVFGGSGFPRAKWQHAFVTQSGGTYATGPQDRAKMITEFAIDRLGRRVSGPVPLVSFNGAGRASCAALAAGPDGLYFSDLYRDAGNDPTAGGARILRVRYLGAGDFTALPQRGAAPLEVQFIDTSAGGSDWQWDFGDGATSTEQSPAHTYAADGAYTVQLRLADGRTVRKDNFVIVGDDGGLTAEYFAGANLEARVFTRLDPTVNFEWGGDAPDPRLAPDSFSVRWRGKVTPAFSETYTFTTVSDDGARLWVNGKKLVDHWIAHAPTEDSATIALVAGRSYDVRMEMYEAGGGAVAQLLWSSASVPRQAVPASALTPLAEPFALPDAAIAAVRPVTFAGINRANTSAIGQTLTQRAAVDQERSFHVKIRNRGRGTDWIVVQGAAGTPGFHTHYFADEDDVTNAVTNGTYAISLAAGASRVLRVEVTPNATTAAGDAFHARVQVTASADATRTDVVDGVVVRQ